VVRKKAAQMIQEITILEDISKPQRPEQDPPYT